MLDLKVTIDNDKVVIAGLEKIAARMPGAVNRGLRRSAAGIYAIGMQWLSGKGGQTRTYSREWSAGGEVRTKKKYGAAPGGYPVPVRTGHLRRSLNWLAPGQSKSGDVGIFTAGPNEVVVFNSASYARAIFLGLGSSAQFGPRDALKDALEMFNRGAQIQQMIGEEIQKEINKQ
jgi:hypothetical protein